MRNIIYCSICGHYYLRNGDELTQIDDLEVTAEEMDKCLENDRYWGSLKNPKTCGCDKKYEDMTKVKCYKAEYEDDNFEIIVHSSDKMALQEAVECKSKHGKLLELSEVNEDDYEIIRKVEIIP